MSVPVIAGAVLAECLSLAAGGTGGMPVSWASLAVGTLCAAVFGFFSVKLLLRQTARGSLVPFAVYLLLLSAALLLFRGAFGA